VNWRCFGTASLVTTKRRDILRPGSGSAALLSLEVEAGANDDGKVLKAE